MRRKGWSKKGMKYSPETREQALKLLGEGMTIAEVAGMVKAPAATVHYWKKRGGAGPPVAGDGGIISSKQSSALGSTASPFERGIELATRVLLALSGDVHKQEAISVLRLVVQHLEDPAPR